MDLCGLNYTREPWCSQLGLCALRSHWLWLQGLLCRNPVCFLQAQTLVNCLFISYGCCKTTSFEEEDAGFCFKGSRLCKFTLKNYWKSVKSGLHHGIRGAPVVIMAAVGKVKRLMFVLLLPGIHWLKIVSLKPRRWKTLRRRLEFLMFHWGQHAPFSLGGGQHNSWDCQGAALLQDQLSLSFCHRGVTSRTVLLFMGISCITYFRTALGGFVFLVTFQ